LHQPRSQAKKHRKTNRSFRRANAIFLYHAYAGTPEKTGQRPFSPLAHVIRTEGDAKVIVGRQPDRDGSEKVRCGGRGNDCRVRAGEGEAVSVCSHAS
jgi:hypothetical protein